MIPVPQPAIDLIASFEGLSLTPYRCPAGYWTVGYGHRCEASQEPISDAVARELLEADAQIAGDAVVRLTPSVGLTDGQYGALTSFVFNLGAGAYQASTLRRCVLAGDTPGAAAQFARWVYAGGRKLPGLIRRRAAERAMFMSVNSDGRY